jgi:hypothetical protein
MGAPVARVWTPLSSRTGKYDGTFSKPVPYCRVCFDALNRALNRARWFRRAVRFALLGVVTLVATLLGSRCGAEEKPVVSQQRSAGRAGTAGTAGSAGSRR